MLEFYDTDFNFLNFFPLDVIILYLVYFLNIDVF